MNIDDYKSNWSKKLSISEEEIQKEYNTIVDEEKQIHPALTEEDHKDRALQRLGMTYKKQLRSPAVGFEGIIIAASNPIDIVAKMRQEAKKMYKENQQMAIENGVTDCEGNPLDHRETWKNGKTNFSFGKPLPEHNWIRSVYGIAKKTKSEEKPKFFQLNVSGEKANAEVLKFKPINFRAIDKTQPEEAEIKYTLNSSAFTVFTEVESEMPSMEEIINGYCGHLKVGISDLDKYHTANETDYNRLCIIEGDVSSLILEPTAFGSRIMTIEDDNSMDIESPGITCWVPEGIEIDFAEQSKVYVIGRTQRGKKNDEQGNKTEEPGDVMMNVCGLYCIPKFKISPTIKELEEDAPTKEPEESW